MARHANIKQPEFDVPFFQGFAIVLNGLDNLDARRHVNRMCLAANVPLVESGTAGYKAQASILNPNNVPSTLYPKHVPLTLNPKPS